MKEEQSIMQAPFKFTDLLFTESSIKLEKDTKGSSIDIRFDPKGTISEKNKTFEINLGVKLESEDGLKVSVRMLGFFEFKNVVKLEQLNNYFYVNGPAILFPYLRSYLSALTALSGTATIIIPPMNIIPLGKDLEQNTIVIDKVEDTTTEETE